jgi:hypothetical protein
MGEGDSVKNADGKLKGKESLGIPKFRWENNIKLHLQ